MNHHNRAYYAERIRTAKQHQRFAVASYLSRGDQHQALQIARNYKLLLRHLWKQYQATI